MVLGPLEVNISQVDYGTLPVADRRLQVKTSSSGSVDVSAGSTYSFLNVAGSGEVNFIYHDSTGITPLNSKLRIKVDSINVREIYYFDIGVCKAYGLNTAGEIYQLGTSFLVVRAWNTTDNHYTIRHFYVKAPFASSLSAELYNNDSTDTATMQGQVVYCLYTSSKNIYLKPSQWWGQNVQELRKLIKKDYKECEAVVMDRYIINPDDPENQQISAPRLQIIIPDWIDEKKIIERMIKEGIAEDVL